MGILAIAIYKLISNQKAAQILRQHGATACTDVTGFGLLGHLLEMLQASDLSAELELDAVPRLPGAAKTIAEGILSSLHPDNLRTRRAVANIDEASQRPAYPILFDPQTSGGLLVAADSENRSALQDAFKIAGEPLWRIGEIVEGPPGRLIVA